MESLCDVYTVDKLLKLRGRRYEPWYAWGAECSLYFNERRTERIGVSMYKGIKKILRGQLAAK